MSTIIKKPVYFNGIDVGSAECNSTSTPQDNNDLVNKLALDNSINGVVTNHKDLDNGYIHQTHNWEFANLEARDAKVDFVLTDVGKECAVGNNISGWNFYKVSKVDGGVATWTSGNGVSGVSQTYTYIPMVYGGFETELMTINNEVKIPRFVCMTDGRLMLTKVAL